MTFPAWRTKHMNSPLLGSIRPAVRVTRFVSDLMADERLSRQELQDLQMRRLRRQGKHGLKNCRLRTRRIEGAGVG